MFRTVLTSVDSALAPKGDADADPAYLPYVPPDTVASLPDVDAMLARDMRQLTVEERNEALNDVHGIVDDRHKKWAANRCVDSSAWTTNIEDLEELDMENKCLRELDVELNKMPHKPIYNQALLQNAAYVQDEKLRLMMIRGSHYQPSSAARLFERYLATKLELFGPEKLTREITQEDFAENANDQKVLESGMFQVGPPDSVGRNCYLVFPFFRPEGVPLISVLRTNWFMDLMAIQESPKTQKLGMVKIILNNLNPGGYTENVMMVWNLLRTKACLPSRLASFHYLYNHPLARPAVSMVSMVGGAFVRARMKVHYGEPDETNIILKTYGVPTQLFPTLKDGKLVVDRHLKQLQERRALEQKWRLRDTALTAVVSDESDASVGSSRPATPIRECVPNGNDDERSVGIAPRPQDCLFGKRGNLWKEQPGNRLYTQCIERHFEAYECAPKYRKQEIADVVIQAVYDAGGVFLIFDSSTGTWNELDDQASLREKAGNYFRNRRRDLNRMQKQLQR